MSILTTLIRADLIDWECDDESPEAFFQTKAEELHQKNYVEATFGDALVMREREFPTGLQLEQLAVAIPHTYAEHVKQPFIYITRLLNSTMSFIQMGTDDHIVYPRYILILGIKNPKAQVGLLSELMEHFADPVFIKGLEQAKTRADVLKFLIAYEGGF